MCKWWAADFAVQDAAFRIQAGQVSEMGDDVGPHTRRQFFKAAAEVAVVAAVAYVYWGVRSTMAYILRARADGRQLSPVEIYVKQ